MIEEEFVYESVRDNNMIYDSGERIHYVFLPPSYYDSDKSYPVIYFFHGYTETANRLNGLKDHIYDSMEVGDLDEFILVSVNVENAFGGSFIANSDLIGNWEEAVIDELIPFIEDEYRILDNKESRGIMGFSMGGYIAVKLGFEYPDMFNAIYSISPGLLLEDDLGLALEYWDDHFLKAYGYAFSTRPDGWPIYMYPTLDGSDEDNVVVEEWMKGFGNLRSKVHAYIEQTSKLRGIALEVAENDYYKWIYNGTTGLSSLLDENGIEHTLEITQNNHSLTKVTVLENALPYLIERLVK